MDMINRLKLINKWLKDNSLLMTIIGGVVFGVIIGICLRPLRIQEDYINLIAYPGELFMRLLKLIILPLIISSLVAGSASLNAKMSSKIALRTFTFFLTTTTFNAIYGISLAMIVQPGSPDLRSNLFAPQRQNEKASNAMDNLLDLGRNIIPDNLFQSTFQQAFTLTSNSSTLVYNQENKSFENVVKVMKYIKYRPGINTLGLVFFCLLFGTILGTIGEKGAVIVNFFTGIFEVIMRMVTILMWLTPLGVCSIIIGKILSVSNLSLVVYQLAWFITTIILGVLIYQLVILQLVYFIFLRQNPFKFYIGLADGILTAFATASTAAALPITFKLMDGKLGIDPRITKFILPIGCNINTDGTAMFIAAATIFIAQMNQIVLGASDLITICFATIAASFSVSSVPSSALVMILMVLSTINIPTNDVTLLFAIDWLLDRFRTTNNMLSDCYCAAIVEKLSEKELKELDGNRDDIAMNSLLTKYEIKDTNEQC